MLEKTTSSNPCVRCGTERVVLRTWVEESEQGGRVSRLTHTLMVCPDAACQAKVEKELQRKEDARAERVKSRQADDLARQRNASERKANLSL